MKLKSLSYMRTENCAGLSAILTCESEFLLDQASGSFN